MKLYIYDIDCRMKAALPIASVTRPVPSQTPSLSGTPITANFEQRIASNTAAKWVK